MFRFALVCLFVCAVSFADFSGTWKGKGRAWDTAGFQTVCSDMKVEIEEGEDVLTLKAVDWQCDDAGMSWADLTFKGKPDATYFKGVSDAWEMPLVFEGTLREDGSLLYHEEWQGKDSTFFVEGTLTR